MEQVVPWDRLLKLIEPHYPKAGKGRQPTGLVVKLKKSLSGVSVNSGQDHIKVKTGRVSMGNCQRLADEFNKEIRKLGILKSKTDKIPSFLV